MHAEHVRRLTFHVDRAHVHFARETEHRASRRGRDAVLPGPRLGDDPRLAELLGEEHLAERVVDLVCPRVTEVLALEPQLGDRVPRRVERSRKTVGAIERRRSAYVVRE